MIVLIEIKRAMAMGWSLPKVTLEKVTSVGKAEIDVHSSEPDPYYRVWWYADGVLRPIGDRFGSIDDANEAYEQEYTRRLTMRTATAGAENVDADGREVPT